MKKLRLSVVIIFLTFALVGVAYASAYEWITELKIEAFNGTGGTPIKFKWTTQTSSAWEEYRSAYYAVTSATGTPAGWTEWNTCRHHSVVNTSVTDQCYVTSTPSVATSSLLWIRVTTNYAGCGTYTPNPDTGSCGDIAVTSTPINP